MRLKLFLLIAMLTIHGSIFAQVSPYKDNSEANRIDIFANYTSRGKTVQDAIDDIDSSGDYTFFFKSVGAIVETTYEIGGIDTSTRNIVFEFQPGAVATGSVTANLEGSTILAENYQVFSDNLPVTGSIENHHIYPIWFGDPATSVEIAKAENLVSATEKISVLNNTVFVGSFVASGDITADSFTGNLVGDVTGNVTGQAGTVATITGLAPDTATTQAAQPNITSVGTLTNLDVDNVNINGDDVTMPEDGWVGIGTSNERIEFNGGSDAIEVEGAILRVNGNASGLSFLELNADTEDDDSKVNFSYADSIEGYIEYDHDSTGANEEMKFNVNAGNRMTIDGSGDVVFTGDLSGIGSLTATNLTGTLQTAAQPNITSLGTLTSLITAGNVGIGVTPEAWNATYKALQLGGNGALMATSAQGASGIFSSMQNAYFDGAWKYISTDEASLYTQSAGKHEFNVATVGTADAAVSWTTAMTIDNSANVSIPNGFLGLGDGGEKTISGGAITVTHTIHNIDTEADAASDDLDTINGGSINDIMYIRLNSASRIVTIKNGTGNIFTSTGADFVYSNAIELIRFMKVGANWYAQI